MNDSNPRCVMVEPLPGVLMGMQRTEWQGLMDAIGTNYYKEIAQMRPVLESISNELIAA